jgi:hypothetical protein
MMTIAKAYRKEERLKADSEPPSQVCLRWQPRYQLAHDGKLENGNPVFGFGLRTVTSRLRRTHARVSMTCYRACLTVFDASGTLP